MWMGWVCRLLNGLTGGKYFGLCVFLVFFHCPVLVNEFWLMSLP